MGANNIVKDKAEDFALRVVKTYKHLTSRAADKEFVLSKQLLRSETSIGANIAESEYAISKDDFRAKLYIALKECNESATGSNSYSKPTICQNPNTSR